MLRIIIDNSALHGERFEELVSGPMLTEARRRYLAIYLTPVLIGELLSAYEVKRDTGWQRKLAFLLDAESGIFLDKAEIWRGELLEGRGPAARHFRMGRDSRRMISVNTLRAHLRRVADTGDLSTEWRESATERLDARVKKENQRKISVEVRQEVASQLRDYKGAGSIADASFSTFIGTDFVRTGVELMTLVHSVRHGALAGMWKMNPWRYPFYSAFVEGFMFHGFHAGAMHSSAIDRNAQSDYEQLCYLTWADIVVSDDTKFFKEAFERLWKPRGKQLMSCAEFVSFARALVP